MTVARFLEDIRQHLNLRELDGDAEDGYRVSFDDDLEISIQPLSTTLLRLEAEIQPVPADDYQAEVLCRKVLQAALARSGDEAEVCFLDRDTGMLSIHRHVRTEELGDADFSGIAVVEDFVNHLETWRAIGAESPSFAMHPMHLIKP